MTIDIHSEEGQIVRQLIPLATLPADQFNSLCHKLSVENAESGTFLFKRNDNISELLYLINGSISLQSDNLKVDTIEAGSESARFALAHQIPRKIDAYTNTSVRFLRLDFDILNALPSIPLEENTTMFNDELEIDDNENNDDWMSTLLKSPIFRALPPANLQQIMINLEEVEYEKGDLIIKQGDSGDFYYLIKQGQCIVSRKPSPNAKEIKLAQLRKQDTFGEDSLLSGEQRNVNITALTSTTLLRLSKDKFISLIKEPTLKYIDSSEIEDNITKGATLLDVRTPDEYNKHHIPNSINAPFFSLRMQIKTLDKQKPIIVVCANGKTSEAAAFLLLRHKFKSLIVKGGIEKAPNLIEDSKPIDKPATKSTEESGSQLKHKLELIAEPKETSAPQVISKPVVNKQIEDQQATLKTENQKLKQEIKGLISKKNELETKHLTLHKQIETQQASLKTENQQLNQEIKGITEQKNELEKKYLSLQKQAKTQQSSVERENQKINQDFKALMTERNGLETKYLDLYQQTEKLKAILDTIKIS